MKRKQKSKIKSKLIILLLVSLFLGNFGVTNTYAKTLDINHFNRELGISIDESSKINLYGNSDQIVAYFFNLKDGGYIIIDCQNNDYVEYSTESENLFITNPEKKYFYGGALNYFEENSANTIKKVATNEIVNKKVAVLERNDEDIEMDIVQPYTVFPPGSFTKKLSYTPRTYNTNKTGICGSTASAILLAYYYDHINKKYVDKSLITSDGKALTNKMKSYIEPSTPGSNYTTLPKGLNNYLASRGLSRSAKKINLKEGAEKIYTNKQPVIAGVTKHPTYKEHWVVAYGFSMKSLLVQSYIVNNGWGQNGITINAKYLDGAVCI